MSGVVEEKRIFGHLGWRPVHNKWVYLYAAGAIGPRLDEWVTRAASARLEGRPPVPESAIAYASLTARGLVPNRWDIFAFLLVLRAAAARRQRCSRDFGARAAASPITVSASAPAAIASRTETQSPLTVSGGRCHRLFCRERRIRSRVIKS
jgi:hypothetical protein